MYPAKEVILDILIALDKSTKNIPFNVSLSLIGTYFFTCVILFFSLLSWKNPIHYMKEKAKWEIFLFITIFTTFWIPEIGFTTRAIFSMKFISNYKVLERLLYFGLVDKNNKIEYLIHIKAENIKYKYKMFEELKIN